jgi:hypothetical protein
MQEVVAQSLEQEAHHRSVRQRLKRRDRHLRDHPSHGEGLTICRY